MPSLAHLRWPDKKGPALTDRAKWFNREEGGRIAAVVTALRRAAFVDFRIEWRG